MGSTNWDYADAAQLARRTNWFSPFEHEGLGLGVEIEPRDDIEDPEPKKIIVGGG
jgi:hypothetical protein